MKRAGGRAGHGSRYSRGGPETAATRQRRRKVAAAAAFKFAARPGPGPRPPASLSASHGEGARRANSEAGGPGARCPFLPRRGCTRQHSYTMTCRPESPDVPRAMIVIRVCHSLNCQCGRGRRPGPGRGSGSPLQHWHWTRSASHGASAWTAAGCHVVTHVI
jgi:hypothetical protein